MQVKIASLISGAKKAEGLVVIIDVLRAATTACHILEKKPLELRAIDDIEHALGLKKDGYVLVGEKEGLKIPGFDYGNSPSEIEKTDLKDKKVILRTSSGVAGVWAAKKADEILLAGFVNAEATIEYIKKKSPPKVTLVAMGWSGKIPADEDILCAKYLRDRLENKKTDYGKIREKVVEGNGAEKFLDPGKKEFPEEDLMLSLELDRFKSIVKAKKKQGIIYLSSSSCDASSFSSQTSNL